LLAFGRHGIYAAAHYLGMQVPSTMSGGPAMKHRAMICYCALMTAVVFAAGCSAPTIDFADIQRPDRPAELDHFNVFVGSWVWEAELMNAEGEARNWSGTAEWGWILDDRCLHGLLSAKSTEAQYDSAGVWTFHPKKKRYEWTMYNNWGYPQHGKAKYDTDTKTWMMTYSSTGLDGRKSYGRHKLQIVSDDEVKWCNEEWADPLHMFKKFDMQGVFKRKQ
jgi:hypothetical protein